MAQWSPLADLWQAEASDQRGGSGGRPVALPAGGRPHPHRRPAAGEGVDPADSRGAGPQPVHHQPGDTPQWSVVAGQGLGLPAARRPPPRRTAAPAPQDGQDRAEPRATGLRPAPPRTSMEPGTDLPGSAGRLPRPAGDARGPRDDLPGPLRPRPRRAPPRTDQGAEDRAGDAPAAPAVLQAPASQYPGDGDDQRAARRSHRPRRSRALGRRPHHRQGRQISHRYPPSAAPVT